METFLVRNGKRLGPYTLYRVRELLEEGEIDGSTLGWMQGETAWVPIRDIPAVHRVIQELEQAKLDEKLSQTPPPLPVPEASVPPQRLPSHAFARFGARMMDVLIVQTLVALIWGIPEPPAGLRDVQTFSDFWEYAKRGPSEEETAFTQKVLLLKFGGLYVWHLMEVVLIAMIGTTPGKYLFRIHVTGPDGQLPGFGRSMGRSFLVLLTGMGMGIEPIQWIANFFGFLRVQNRGITLWDQTARTQVHQLPMTQVRLLLALAVFGLLVASRYWL